MKSIAASKAPKTPAAKRVPIEVHADKATMVAITGDFNRWSKEGVRLSHNGNGTWRTVLELAPGEYQYRLIVDDQWHDHPEAAKRVPNPFGTVNCVLIVV